MLGWLVATDGPLTLALDIEGSDALKQEGVARELINRIQNIRKDSGFDVTDRVKVTVYADGADRDEIADSLAHFKEYIASQTLALEVELKPLDGSDGTEVEWNETPIKIKVVR